MDHSKKDQKLAFVTRDRLVLAIGAVGFLAGVMFVFARSWTPDWHDHQVEFREVVRETLGDERAEAVPTGMQQIFVEPLGVADRCITCHQGVSWKGLEKAPHPYRTHPKEILEKHPIDRFGCTPCHGGQGYATEESAAHGLVEHWEEPMLGKELAEFYVISNRTALMQMNCNSCHRYDKTTKGAEVMNRAKQLVQEKGCRACHVINGRGGTVGPDLTWEGDKSAEQFNYERIKGLHTQFTWQVAHFKNPKELVPETVMPMFNFSSADAQALALLVMSWRKHDRPLEYWPDHNVRDIPTPDEVEREARMLTGPGAFFVKKNCFVCHSVSTLGIEAAAQIGPDLALAVEDVPSRFARTLDDFLQRPTGTMEVVLSTMITLSPEERAEAVSKLKLAYELKQKERAQAKRK